MQMFKNLGQFLSEICNYFVNLSEDLNNTNDSRPIWAQSRGRSIGYL